MQATENAYQETGFVQFAYVDEPFLSWDFSLLSADKRLIGSVNRNFAGFAREIFTDTGVYALRMDAVGLAQESRHLISQTGHAQQANVGMTLDQRALMLATAVSIDFDYFSRQSSGAAFGILPGIPWPLWLPGAGVVGEAGAVGGAAEAGAAGGGAAGAGVIGSTTEGAGAAVGQAARGAGAVGAGEGAIAGAGTMAGYEAMHRGVYGNREEVSREPSANNINAQDQSQRPEQHPGGGEEVWGEQQQWPGNDDNPSQGPNQWGGSDGGGGGGGGGEGGGGGGGGGGGVDWTDWF